MIIVYSYHGILPLYTIYTIYQSRLFSNDKIYLITDDLQSPIINIIKKYDVLVISYNEVRSEQFDELINSIGNYPIVKELISVNRENLFLFSLERFFLLYNLMKIYDISNILFLELDNMIYDDPENWKFNYDLSYLYIHKFKSSTGIMYVKSFVMLEKLLNKISEIIKKDKVSEMYCTYVFAEENKNIVEYLPNHYDDHNFKNYNSIFDGLAIGVYMFGYDPIHTGGKIVTNAHLVGADRQYLNEIFEWKYDDKERKIPYIYNKNNKTFVRINNLHIHSKTLEKALSTTYL